jgi:hypothetical protein
MFAPPVAKPKAMQPQRSVVLVRRPEEYEKENNTTRTEAHAATLPWDFSEISVFPPGGAERFQVPPAFRAPRLPIQVKHVVGQVDDPLEYEADQVADQVTLMPPGVSGATRPPQISRKCPAREEEAKLQKKPTGTSEVPSGDVPGTMHEVLRSPGQPLDAAARAYFEPRFGRDFSQVRVHADPRAADLALASEALAVTIGRDIVFGNGQYAMGSHEGRRLIAHELSHVIQQEFTRQAIQRQAAPKKKPLTINFAEVFKVIEKRDPDLAKLITPQSIDLNSPKNPPPIKGGPVTGGEEHIWKVQISRGAAFSSATKGGEQRTKLKSHTQITHFIDISWALPLVPAPEFVQQTGSQQEAFTLTAAEPLFHELLHARIMMERDSHWTGQHTEVFQDYADFIKLASSAPVESKDLQQKIRDMASGVLAQPQAVDAAVAEHFEFLVHEKFDREYEGWKFGRHFSNAEIAKKNSDVVARRLGLTGPGFQGLTSKLHNSAEKLFDKLDAILQAIGQLVKAL